MIRSVHHVVLSIVFSLAGQRCANEIPSMHLSTHSHLHTHICMHACARTHACKCVCLYLLHHNDRPTVGEHHPEQAGELCIPGRRAVNPSADYKLKHAARSHQCFSKYFQSWCLEKIARGQRIDLPNKGRVLRRSGFIGGWEQWNWVHLLRKGDLLTL